MSLKHVMDLVEAGAILTAPYIDLEVITEYDDPRDSQAQTGKTLVVSYQHLAEPTDATPTTLANYARQCIDDGQFLLELLEKE